MSNSLVSAEQLAKILDKKLEEKLVPLNQTVMELRKAVDEVVKHSKFIDTDTTSCLGKSRLAMRKVKPSCWRTRS